MDFLVSKYGVIFTEFDSIDRGGAEVNTLNSNLVNITPFLLSKSPYISIMSIAKRIMTLHERVFIIILLLDTYFLCFSYIYWKIGSEGFCGTRIYRKPSFLWIWSNNFLSCDSAPPMTAGEKKQTILWLWMIWIICAFQVFALICDWNSQSCTYSVVHTIYRTLKCDAN